LSTGPWKFPVKTRIICVPYTEFRVQISAHHLCPQKVSLIQSSKFKFRHIIWVHEKCPLYRVQSSNFGTSFVSTKSVPYTEFRVQISAHHLCPWKVSLIQSSEFKFRHIFCVHENSKFKFRHIFCVHEKWSETRISIVWIRVELKSFESWRLQSATPISMSKF
jgi:hypothetical protein